MSPDPSDPKRFPFPHLAFGVIVFGVVFWLFANPQQWSMVLGPLHYDADSTLYPFLDMHGRLAAFEAHRAGIDILRNPNPLDPLSRVNVKPTWPLHLSFLGLNRDHLALCGFVTVVGFLALVVAIIRPRYWRELLMVTPVVLSPPIFLGIERANDDLVYLILIASVIPLLRLRPAFRFWLVWLVIFLLAPAKYYPGAAFALFLLEVKEPKRIFLLFLAGVGFLAAYLGTNYEEVLYLKDAVPKPSLFFVHGSGLLFESLGLPGSLGKVFVLGLLGLGAWIVCRPGDGGIPDGSRSGRWYILGYSIFLFCYSLNSNYDYRFVYVLPMVPLLLSFYRRRAAAPGRGWAAGAMLVLLIPILWTDIWFMHAGREDGRWTMEYITVATAAKNVLLAAFMVGATYFAAQLLRPNLRQLFAAFVGGRNQSLEKKA